MNRLLKVLALILTLAVLASSVPLSFATQANAAEAKSLVPGSDYAAGEVLFNICTPQNSQNVLNSVESKCGIKVLEKIDQSALNADADATTLETENEVLYRAAFDESQTSVYEVCKALNKLTGVRDAEPNYLYAPDSFDMPSEITDSSTYRSYQKWYFDNMNIPSAWERYSNLGEGALVCVIDNGLNFTHNEIKNRLWDDGNGNHGYNAEFNNHDIYGKLEDGPAHGSHCAGIIAMESSNGGLIGVAPKAKIMACNAVSSASGMFTNANLIKSLEYAVENGADVISMSLGGYAFSLNMEKALARASLSAVILCAAGNDGLSTSTALHFPAASSAVIGVMALGSGSSANTLADYSNYDATGRYYQVAAPGTSIYAIASQSDTSYVRMTGTSMATPFMAGIAALYVAEHPELSAPEARRAIIDAAGEMVAAYNAPYLSLPFKKATAYTMLDETPAAPKKVALQDRVLDAAVRSALETDTSHIFTDFELESVSYLDLRGSSFKNYAAINDLPKLTYLNLSSTDMDDENAASLAAYLPESAIAFDISGNRLTNLDLFKKFPGYVCRLSAASNSISDISGIAEFTMLSDLDISCNAVKDISPVSGLTGLVYFYAPGNLIEDVSPIIPLPLLEEVYFGNYNPSFTDMFGETYFLSGSQGNLIASLEPFMELSTSSRLHYINLSYNFVNKDERFNYRAAKLMQILDDICRYHDFKSIFADSVAYKLVLSPFAKGDYITANDIAFKNGRNFVSLYLNSTGYTLPYTVMPENANVKTGVRFDIKDSTIAFVDNNGVVYPKAAGSTYITLTLESGRVRTFFLTVKDSFVLGADFINPSSTHVTGTPYKLLVYTAPSTAIKITDQNANSFGTFDANSKYCYNLEDKNGNAYQKWVVPIQAENAGNYSLSIAARAQNSTSFSQVVAQLPFDVEEKFGNEVYGFVYAYNSRFDTTVSLFAPDNTLLQQVTLQGGTESTNRFSFQNVANGSGYSIRIERDGYKPYFIKDITVNGDTFADDNTDTASFADCAGDFNADSVIDIADISVLLAENNYSNSTCAATDMVCDLNADSSIDIADLAIVLANHAK